MIREQRVRLLNLIESKKANLPWYVNEFLEHLDGENASPNTQLDYCYDIESFLDWIIAEGIHTGESRNIPIEVLEKLKVKDMTTYQNHCKNYLGNKRNTIARKLSSLKSLFYYLSQVAEDEDLYPYLKRNVMAKIKIYKEKSSKKKMAEHIASSILLGEEFRDFREFIAAGYGHKLAMDMNSKRLLSGYHRNRERDLAFASLILGSGLRASEALSINIDNIDWTKNMVHVTRKGDIVDFVVFSDLAAQDLRDYISVRQDRYDVSPKEKALFLSCPTKNGRSTRVTLRAMQKRFERYFKAYEKNTMSIHKLRHSFATKHFQENNNLAMLKELLNHSDINTTMIYTHVLSNEIQDSVNKADK